MAVDLTHHLEDIARAVKDPRILKLAAEAMGDEMKRATARYIGADLRMSNFRGGPAEFITESKGAAVVTMKGGTYALADTGRRQATPARAFGRGGRGGRALRTPWGPKRSVRGSTWAGFGITEKHSPDAIDAGIRVVVAELEKVVS